jgi:regulator of sigma E protease
MEELMLSMQTFGAVLGLIAGFGFLVFIHELGHFLAAKWVGIKVTQFAIGFGPSIAAWRKGLGFRWGSTEAEYAQRVEAGEGADSLSETEYRLNWMPLGGYVKMLGQEDLDATARSDDERSFNRKPIWARACVVSAGVVMNLITGAIFFIIAFRAGVEFPPAIVGGVAKDSPASNSFAIGHEGDPAYRGLRAGDLIIQVDDKQVLDFTDVAVEAALAERDKPLELVVSRDGEPRPLVFDITPREDRGTQLLALGIGRPISLTLTHDALAPQALPLRLSQAGVEPGMSIVEVDHHPVTRFDQYERLISQSRGEPEAVTFADKKGHRVEVNLSAAPIVSAAGRDEPNLLGLVPAIKVPFVVPGSPAHKAGLQSGDILAKIGPTRWPTWDQVIEVVQQSDGRPIELNVMRNGDIVELSPPTASRDGKIGIQFGLAIDEPIVARTLPGTPADRLNLSAGSRILSVNGREVHGYGDILRCLTAATENLIVTLPEVNPPATEPDLLLAETPTVATQTSVTEPSSTTPASEEKPSGLDTIVSHESTLTPAEAAAPVTAPATEPQPPLQTTVSISYLLNIASGVPDESQLTLDAEAARYLASIEWDQPIPLSYFYDLNLPLAENNPIKAARLGLRKTRQVMLQTYVTLLRLFQGTVKPSHLRGPLGIADDGATFAKQGWSYLMFFLGLISINLVVINFLPIPVVDGGLMLFLLIEKIKGSPVNARIQQAASIIGMTLIGCVFLLTLFYDAKRLLGL